MVWAPLFGPYFNQCIFRADGICKRVKGPVIVDLGKWDWLIASCAMANSHSQLSAAWDLDACSLSHGRAQDSLYQRDGTKLSCVQLGTTMVQM